MKLVSPEVGTIPYITSRELWQKNSFLVAILYGVRTVFSKALEIKDIEFKFTDDIKRTLDLRGTFKYPRIFFQVNSIHKAKERVSGYSMSRAGLYAKTGEGEALKECIAYPIELSMEFHYQHTDNYQMLQIMEALVMLTFVPTMSFKLTIADAFEHVAAVSFEDDITINQFEIESSADPGSAEIVLPFTVKSHVGLVMDKQWVNIVDSNEAGLKLNVSLDGTTIDVNN